MTDATGHLQWLVKKTILVYSNCLDNLAKLTYNEDERMPLESYEGLLTSTETCGSRTRDSFILFGKANILPIPQVQVAFLPPNTLCHICQPSRLSHRDAAPTL